MFSKFLVVLALILALSFVNVFALADDPNSGTKSMAVRDGYVVYTFTVSFSTDDSTNNLTTPAFSLAFADPVNHPISIVAYGNAVASADVNLAILTSNFVKLTSFVTSACLLDAAGAAAGKQGVMGGAGDSTGVTLRAGAHGLYGVVQCDGQTGNKSTVVMYIKVFVPAKAGYTKTQLLNLAGFVDTT